MQPGRAGLRARALGVRRAPEAPTERVTWLFLVCVLVVAALTVPVVLVDGSGDAPGRVGLLVVLGGLAWHWTGAQLRGRLTAVSVVPEAAALFVLAVGVGPQRALGLLYVAVILRALQVRTPAQAALGVAALGSAHVAAVLVPDAARGGYGLPAALVQLPMLALVGGSMHLLRQTLDRYEAARGRERATAGELRERDLRERFEVLVQDASEVVTIIDEESTVRFQSAAMERVLGYEPGALVGTRLIDLVHPDDRGWVWAGYRAALGRPGIAPAPIECRWRHRDGSFRWMQHLRNNLLHDPRVGGVVLTSRDVSERVALEGRLRHLTVHDDLTALANRALFEEALSSAVAAAPRRGEQPAVLLLDLDDFKRVNESLGHPAGDELLRTVAERLRAEAERGETVARLAADEFAILVLGDGDAAQLVSRARRLLAAVQEPFEVAGTRLDLRASLGVATATSADGEPLELLRNAAIAMHRAKQAGGGCCQLYVCSMHARAAERLELEGDLRAALERHEFRLFYQPVFSLRSGRPVGCEALLRWRHPRRGLLAPEAFLAVAEATRLSVPIGRWVIDEACRQAQAWHAAGRPISVGLNLSAAELADPGLVEHVGATVAAVGLDPARLVIEVTESDMLHDLDAVARTLRRLKGLGVQLAIDDFGTGWSSLAYLRSLPFDGLKIPRPFVEGIVERGHDFLLTRGVVQLCRGLRLTTVAEGIETSAQLRTVCEIGCDLGQGFALAAPAEAHELEGLLGSAAPRLDLRAA